MSSTIISPLKIKKRIPKFLKNAFLFTTYPITNQGLHVRIMNMCRLIIISQISIIPKYMINIISIISNNDNNYDQNVNNASADFRYVVKLFLLCVALPPLIIQMELFRFASYFPIYCISHIAALIKSILGLQLS